VVRFITENFIPARVHVKEQRDDYKRFADRYGAIWTPTILVLDPEGVERHRVEGFLPAEELIAQLMLGLGHSALKREQWGEAERWFNQVLDRFPQSEAAPESLYWAGVSRYRRTSDATALAETAEAFTHRYSDTGWAKKSSVWGKSQVGTTQ
jgi:phage terminase large subunit-like protein